MANEEPSPCTPEPLVGDLEGWALAGNGGSPPLYSPSFCGEEATDDEVMGTNLEHDSSDGDMSVESQVAEVERTSEVILQELADRAEADSLNAHRW